MELTAAGTAPVSHRIPFSSITGTNEHYKHTNTPTRKKTDLSTACSEGLAKPAGNEPSPLLKSLFTDKPQTHPFYYPPSKAQLKPVFVVFMQNTHKLIAAVFVMKTVINQDATHQTPSRQPRYALTLLGQQQLAADTYLLYLPRAFPFIPGQVVAMALHAATPARLYSIASAPHETELALLYEVVEDGMLTPQLPKLQAGDTVFLSEPFGHFNCPESPAFWIATGTGVAPFRSMFRQGLQDGITLIHGGRYLHNFYFDNEWKTAPGLRYIRCCTQETANGVYAGRLTHYLRDYTNLPSHQKYYLCGSAEMVVEVRDLLIKKGIPFNHINAEIYF